jgi:hypothetical protein
MYNQIQKHKKIRVLSGSVLSSESHFRIVQLWIEFFIANTFLFYISINSWACQLQKPSHEETEDKTNIGRRVFILLLMVYFATMVNVALHGITGGRYWACPGYKLFPIPYDPIRSGHITFPMLVPLNQTDLFIYLNFISNGIWMFWMGIGTLYVMLPWLPRLQAFVDKLKSKISNYWPKKNSSSP